MTDRARPGSWSSVSLSVLLHGVLGLLAVAAYFLFHESTPRQVQLAIEATVVTAAPKKAALPAPEAVSSPPVSSPAVEQEREQAKKQEGEERAEEKRAEAEKEEQQRVARDRAAKEKLVQEKAAAEKAAADKAALAKATLDKEKAEKAKTDKEKAAQQKLAKEKAQADQQRTQREADLNARIAAEERAEVVRNSGKMNQYIAQITAKIEQNWIRPASAQPGLNCEVRVTQVPGGTVTGVQVASCNGDDSVRQSIERAVNKASPLPLPSDPALFERILVVTFRPEN